MKEVELFEQNERTLDRQSSKGNQLKWENQGVWYKADYLGYEGLAEYAVSQLLARSTLTAAEYVNYEPVWIHYKNRRFSGVASRTFLTGDWQIITLERLFQSYFHESLYSSIYQIADHESRLRFLAEQVERITGLKDFGKYLSKLLTLDAVFLNEDRHTHNIAVLMNGNGDFTYCPIFDNGAALFSDTSMEYPLGEDIYQLMDQVRSKTICDSFDEQMDLAEKLYGEQIKFTFSKKDVREILSQIECYSKEEKDRVETLLYQQMRKYPYLFTDT